MMLTHSQLVMEQPGTLVTDGAGNIIFSGVTAGTTHTAGTGLALDGTRFNLTNTSVNYGGVSVALGAIDFTPAFNLVDATGYLHPILLVQLLMLS